jgi:hypothetical protein
METENIQNTSIRTNELVVDRESGSVTTLGAFAGLETALRASRAVIGGDTTVSARETLGQDSVTDVSYTITDNRTGDSRTIEGDLIVGADYVRSQTMAFPTSVAMLLSASLLGMFRGTVRTAVLDAIQSGVEGASTEEVGHAIMNAINLSPEALANGQEVLAEMRRVSARTVSARVSFDSN